jgi:hypothetical protein
LCELGLPSYWAAKIYLSGVRSRQAAKELSLIFKESLIANVNNLSEITDIIVRNKEILKRRIDCSKATLQWVEILDKKNLYQKKTLRRFLILHLKIKT